MLRISVCLRQPFQERVRCRSLVLEVRLTIAETKLTATSWLNVAKRAPGQCGEAAHPVRKAHREKQTERRENELAHFHGGPPAFRMPGSGGTRPNKLAEAPPITHPTRIAGKFSLHSFLF